MGSMLVRGGTTVPALTKAPGHLMWRASARVTQTLAEMLPPGLGVHAFAALVALPEGTSRSQQDIARSIGVSRTTIARIAAELTDAGLVERVRNPDDRRSYALTRTEAGARLIADTWQPQAKAIETRVGGDLTRDERRRLTGLLQRAIGDDLSEELLAPLRSNLGFLITQMHQRMHRSYLAALEPLGLEPRHNGTLVALRDLGPMSQSDLAHALGVTPATVVQIVDELERRGVLERRRDERDRRSQIVGLRPEGRELVRKSQRISHADKRAQLAALTDDEVDDLVALLLRFVQSD